MGTFFFFGSVKNGLHRDSMCVCVCVCVCALLLRIGKVRRKKRRWVHPVVSKRLLNGQFYKLFEDFRNCRGKIFSYFSLSIESF